MSKIKVLYISQEIAGYLPETDISKISRYLPQGIQDYGKEVRSFMPKFGLINERRNQLHEVIRLSGMNIVIDDRDNPLIIKVASIQSARMQVYFIDNEDFFHRKTLYGEKSGKEFPDNDERTIFYARGVLETAKKLRWDPQIIHCHGWMSALAPIYIRKNFMDDPVFAESKIIYSLYEDSIKKDFPEEFAEKAVFDNVIEQDLEHLKEPTLANLHKLAIDYSDGVICTSPKASKEALEYAMESGKPFLDHSGNDDYIDAYNNFYDKIIK
jgi:starch synthase